MPRPNRLDHVRLLAEAPPTTRALAVLLQRAAYWGAEVPGDPAPIFVAQAVHLRSSREDGLALFNHITLPPVDKENQP